MNNKITNLIFIAILFCGFNSTVLAGTVEFETITEALNYSGNKSTVTKLVITGEISGDDYSENSDWSKFKTLNESYPALESIEILTSQDIPDIGYYSYSLFSHLPSIGFPAGTKWLKSFSAPNVKYIGSWAFSFCKNLISVNFPSLITIGETAFHHCDNLQSVDFPLLTTIEKSGFSNCHSLMSVNFPSLTTIGEWAFVYCTGLISATFPIAQTVGDYAFYACNELLTSLSFGTDFTTPTEIKFGQNVFQKVYGNDILTEKIYLTLGENVLPKPNLEEMTWLGNGLPNPYYTQFTWKSITIHTNIEETIKNHTVNIYPNPTVSDFTVSFDLETAGNLTVTLNDLLGQELFEIYNDFTVEGIFSKTFSLKELPQGVYYLKIVHNGNVRMEKVVRQ